MTIVAALVTPTGAWMGGDSISSNGETYELASTPKVGRFGDKLIGFAGSWDGNRVLEIAKKHPELTWAEILFRAGQIDKDIAFLCVERGRIYLSQSNKERIQRARRGGHSYSAIGSGEAVAIGSLYSWHDGREALVSALSAAEAHTPTVRRPFKIVSL